MTVRTRTRGQYVPGPTPFSEARFRTCAETNWSLGGYGNACLAGEKETMSDVVIPGFDRRKSLGEVFFNDMTQTKIKASLTGGEWGWKKLSTASPDCTNPIQRQEHRGITPGFMAHWARTTQSGSIRELAVSPIITSNEESDAVTEATTRCLSNRGRSDSNLWESMAEINKTLQMVRKPLQSIYRLTTKAKTEKLKLIKQLGSDYNPASLWLQYRYGILPLVRDIEGILRGLKEKTGHVRTTSRGNVSLSRSNTVQFVSSISPLNVTVLEQTTDDLQVRAMSLDEYVASVESNVGFTTKGLITLPWELIKLSFVVDWALNVGDYLGAISPSPGFKQLGSCVVVTRTTRCVSSCLNTAITVTWGEITQSVSGVATIQKITKTRRALGKPGLVVKADFRLDDNTRLADAFSLLAQQLMRAF